MSTVRSAKDLVHYYYDELCAMNVEVALEVLHPRYRSLSSDNEPSREALMAHYSELIQPLDRLDRRVQLVVEEAPWVGIVQTFRCRYLDGHVERYHSSDYFRLENGMFIEHQGVIVKL